MAHGDYAGAAKYMLQYALRIEQLVERKTADSHKLQLHCLCHVLSAMDLVPAQRRFVLVDFKLDTLRMSRFRRVLGSAKTLRCVTFAQLKQLYLLTAAKSRLMGQPGDVGQSAAAVDEDELAQWNVEQTANQLNKLELHGETLRLRLRLLAAL